MEHKIEKHDIFVSYRRQAGWELAKLIYTSLTNSGFATFLDTEKLFRCNFETTLKYKLNECKIFIPILTRDTFVRCVTDKEDWVRKEILTAIHSKPKKIIIPIVDDSLIIPKGLPTEMAKLASNKYYKIIHINRDNFQKTVKELNDLIIKLWDDYKIEKKMSQRFNNPYVVNFKSNELSKKEREIKKNEIISNMQNALLENDNKVEIKKYSKVLFKYEKINMLQIFSTSGDQFVSTLSILKQCLNYNSFIGIVADDFGVEIGNKLFGESIPRACFHCIDPIKPNFSVKLKNLSELYSLDGKLHKFNVVILDNLLSYYKDPLSIIQAVYDVMEPDGTIIITDFDDSVNIMYPDTSGVLNKFINLLQSDEQMGNRHTAREIFTYLRRVGFHSINIEREYEDDTNNNYFDRKQYFNNQFIELFEKFAVTKNSPNKQIAKRAELNCEWLKRNYAKIEEAYKNLSSYSGSPIIVWKAKK